MILGASQFGWGDATKLFVEQTSAEEPFSAPELFVEGSFHNVTGKDHAVSEDGRHLLLLKGPPDKTATVLQVIANWFEELRALVPAR